MTDITVCIPAYNSEKSIGKTLRSVQSQSFGNFKVRIGLEPSQESEKTHAVCEQFLADSRFEIQVNPSVLGWSQNISNLLGLVNTPYFIILPHDDALHPDYLAVLHDVIRGRPNVAVAYTDMLFIGSGSGEKFLPIDNQGFSSRLLSFFLAGAEAVPWRGVTRATVLRENATFSHNRYNSYAVECEWALHLIQQGEAHRVPLPMYFKRTYGNEGKNVSKQWGRFNEQRSKAALEHHRRKMLAGISTSRLTNEETLEVKLACESAMLRRYLDLSQNRFTLTNRHLARVKDIRASSQQVKPELAAKILSRIELVLSRNEIISNQVQQAEYHARNSIELDPGNWEALCHLARIHLSRNEVGEALVLSSNASKIAPHASEINHLIFTCQNQISRQLQI